MKLRILIAAVLLTAMCAAQTLTPVATTPKFEFSVGYDRLWNNVSINDLSALKSTFLSGLNGADIGATFNVKPSLGLKVDFSANTQSGNFTTSGKNYRSEER